MTTDLTRKQIAELQLFLMACATDEEAKAVLLKHLLTVNAALTMAARTAEAERMAQVGRESLAEALSELAKGHKLSDLDRIADLERRLAEAKAKVGHFLHVYNGADGGDTDEAINDAVDALLDIVVEHPANRFDCRECGSSVIVDEDGCCNTCGREAIAVLDATQPEPEEG